MISAFWSMCQMKISNTYIQISHMYVYTYIHVTYLKIQKYESLPLMSARCKWDMTRALLTHDHSYVIHLHTCYIPATSEVREFALNVGILKESSMTYKFVIYIYMNKSYILIHLHRYYILASSEVREFALDVGILKESCITYNRVIYTYTHT